MRKRRPPVTPGELLLEEFLKPLGLSANKLALDIRVPANRITGIIAGKRAITANTALRLAKYFGISAQFWMNAQVSYDLEVVEREKGEEIRREVLPRTAV